jgi:glutathione reductase (NADPH)
MKSTSKKIYDLIVIGTGSAGATVAYECRSAGWSVAIMDSRPFGGTCALRGCDPKKVLVGASEVIDWSRRMQGKGVSPKDIKINWQELMKFKKSFTDPVPKNREQGFVDAGIDVFFGQARFVDETTVQVDNKTLTGKYIVIATGAEPMKLGIPGEEHLIDSEQFLELSKLPSSIIFVGGGYISLEFSHIASRAGARVQILHRSKRILKEFDPDLVDQLTKATQDAGIDVQLNTAVASIEKSKSQFIVHTTAKAKKQTFKADLVVHGAGRVPEIGNLDLEKANIASERKGITVNKFFQSTSNPKVYAAGDAASTKGFPLTPVAGLEGEVVASNLLKGNKQTAHYAGMASVVFAIPPLASVGLQEAEAKEQGLKFRINHEDTSTWYTSRRVNEKYTGFKVLIEKRSNLILGAHLLGPHAEEVINLFAMAIRHKIPADELESIPYAYPTASSDIAYMVE